MSTLPMTEPDLQGSLDRLAETALRIKKERDELAAALRVLLNYVGGWDEKPTHPCGRARDVLAKLDDPYA